MTEDARGDRYALVTGGSGGIGLETARGLASHVDVVGIVARNPERLEKAAKDLASTGARVETFQADFSSLAEVRRLARDVKERFPSLSVLVNNAGVWHKDRTLSKDGYEDTFAVNHLAHFLLTTELEDLLVAGAPSRVVNVSSSVHLGPKSLNWEDLMFEKKWRGFAVYSHSKLANVVFSVELARRWKHLGITSNAVHPGNVRSRITRNNALLNFLHRSSLARVFILPEQAGAKTPIYAATASELEGVTGKYFVKSCKEAQPNAVCQDEGEGKRLWEVSQQLIDAAFTVS